MRINCPHCGTVAGIRSSRAVSRLTREMYCQCCNLECGHTFVGLVEVVRTLSPSAVPDPDIEKQLSGHSTHAASKDSAPTPPLDITAAPLKPAEPYQTTRQYISGQLRSTPPR